jgi:hypothetical protein
MAVTSHSKLCLEWLTFRLGENELKWIEVRSRKWAKQYRSDTPWAAISIATEPDTWPILDDYNRFDLLQIAFYDICNPDTLLKGLFQGQVFDRSHALQILDFVARCWDHVDSFLIHCEAGISRSPAVAAAILHIYYGSGADNWYFANCTPNMLVYKDLLHTHYDPRSWMG